MAKPSRLGKNFKEVVQEGKEAMGCACPREDKVECKEGLWPRLE